MLDELYGRRHGLSDLGPRTSDLRPFRPRTSDLRPPALPTSDLRPLTSVFSTALCENHDPNSKGMPKLEMKNPSQGGLNWS
jgi:hypothetical protein